MRYAVAGGFVTSLLFSTGVIAAPATVANPTGKGDPDGVTCRTPQPVKSEMAMRIVHPGPTICRTNAFWAELIKSHHVVAADGAIVPEAIPTTATNNFQPLYQPPPR
jgi:hypothetical protein